MTIQFNLLPTVKLDYIKAQRTKRQVILISSLVAGFVFGIFLLLFITVNVLQKQHLSNLNKDIGQQTAKLEGINDLSKILTVQNQLKTLPGLHEQKPAASRVFGYISQITPNDVSMSNASVDFSTQTITIVGTAKDFNAINKYVDTIKFTNYSVEGTDGTKKAFSDVVLSNFNRDDKTASYQVTFKFDPIIFDNTQKVTLSVPSIISTRSETEKPAALFQQSTGTKQ
jgi:hypothetical protein